MIISEKSAMNLEKACIDAGSKITYPLHNSANDALTLTELYRKLQLEYDFNSLVLKHETIKAEKDRLKRIAKGNVKPKRDLLKLIYHIISSFAKAQT